MVQHDFTNKRTVVGIIFSLQYHPKCGLRDIWLSLREQTGNLATLGKEEDFFYCIILFLLRSSLMHKFQARKRRILFQYCPSWCNLDFRKHLYSISLLFVQLCCRDTFRGDSVHLIIRPSASQFNWKVYAFFFTDIRT